MRPRARQRPYLEAGGLKDAPTFFAVTLGVDLNDDTLDVRQRLRQPAEDRPLVAFDVNFDPVGRLGDPIPGDDGGLVGAAAAGNTGGVRALGHRRGRAVGGVLRQRPLVNGRAAARPRWVVAVRFEVFDTPSVPAGRRLEGRAGRRRRTRRATQRWCRGVDRS